MSDERSWAAAGLASAVGEELVDEHQAAEGPRHHPAQVCDCPNPRPGEPWHCAAGYPPDAWPR